MFFNSEIVIKSKKINLISNKKKYRNDSLLSIVITSKNNNLESKKMTMNLIKSIKKFTKINYSLWVIDNNSSIELIEDFLQNDDINFISIRKKLYWEKYKLNFIRFSKYKLENGSYNNAFMLDVASRLVSKNTKYFLSLHNDIIVCNHNWLEYLISKLDNENKVISSMQDKLRINAMHVSTLLFDFRLFNKLNVNIYPKLKNIYSSALIHDVADDITSKFNTNGYGYFSCKNTYNNHELNDLISDNNIFKNINVDKILDDNNNLILVHLGRGYMKSLNKYNRVNKISLHEWNILADQTLNENINYRS